MTVARRRFSRSLGLVALAGTVAVTTLGVSGAANASGSESRARTITAGDVGQVQAPTKSGTKGFRGEQPTASPESVIGTDGRTQVTDTTAYPARAIGQIEFVQKGLSYICTGWLIDKNSILTSGHCSFDPDGGTGDIIESATFAAGRNGAVDTYGSCSVYQVMAPLAWRQDGDAKSDWSVMQLGTGPTTTCDIGDSVGWFGISWVAGADALTGAAATVQGYPGDQEFGTQWTMSGTISKSTKQMVFYKMDTAGGQSGSPVFDPAGTACGGFPCGMAVHSYGVGLPNAGQRNNAGPRITKARFAVITSYAAENG